MEMFLGLFAKAYLAVSMLHSVLNQLLANTSKLQKEHADLQAGVAFLYRKSGEKAKTMNKCIEAVTEAWITMPLLRGMKTVQKENHKNIIRCNLHGSPLLSFLYFVLK